MTHIRPLDRRDAGCVTVLVDRTAAATGDGPLDAVDDLLHELIARCRPGWGQPPEPLVAATVVGYGGTGAGPVPLLPGVDEDGLFAWPEDLERTCRVTERRRDGRSARAAGWVDRTAAGGGDLAAALAYTGPHLRGWVGDFPTAFPPVVVVLTARDPGAGTGRDGSGDLAGTARRLRSVATADGPVLLFGLAVADEAVDRQPAPANLPAHLVALYRVCSQLPTVLAAAAHRRDVPLRFDGRGFAVVGPDDVAAFLSVCGGFGDLLR